MSEILYRGNKMWESMQMFLPEHNEALKLRKEEKKKVEKPILDEQQWVEIDRVVCEAMEFTYILEITFFRDGFFETIEGYINSYDEVRRSLWIRDQNKVVPIKMIDIVDMKRVRSLT